MSPARFDTADDEGPNPALTPHQEGLIVGSPPGSQGPKAVAERPAMTRRSWYTRVEAVEALAAAVDDIHFATRVPKYEVVAALMEAAVAQAPKVQAKLRKAAGQK